MKFGFSEIYLNHDVCVPTKLLLLSTYAAFTKTNDAHVYDIFFYNYCCMNNSSNNIIMCNLLSPSSLKQFTRYQDICLIMEVWNEKSCFGYN